MMAKWRTTQSDNVVAIQLKWTITIGKLSIYNGDYQYSLNSCRPIYATIYLLNSILKTFITLLSDLLHADVGYCSPVALAPIQRYTG